MPELESYGSGYLTIRCLSCRLRDGKRVYYYLICFTEPSMRITFEFVTAVFPSFPEKANYFTHDRLETRIMIRTYMALKGVVSALLLKQVVYSFYPSADQVDSSIPLERCVSVFCMKLQQR